MMSEKLKLPFQIALPVARQLTYDSDVSYNDNSAVEPVEIPPVPVATAHTVVVETPVPKSSKTVTPSPSSVVDLSCLRPISRNP